MLQEQLPNPDLLNQLFTDLLDIKTEVFMGKPLRLNRTNDPMIVATYANDQDVITGLCICDLKAANRMGSALSMIPGELANKSIEKLQVTDDVMKNMKEIMDALTGFLNVPGLPGLKLKDMMLTSDGLAETITLIASDPGMRLDLEVAVQNYGSGYISILL